MPTCTDVQTVRCALVLYEGNDDRIFVRTAQRNDSYVAELLGSRPITSYAT